MTKSIFHIHSIPQPLARSLAIAAILAIVVLSIGGALAQRMEQRAAADRLSFGDSAEACADLACGATGSAGIN